MIGYIYKTTNLVNGKIYIGQHKSSVFDENYKGSGHYLWNAITKYGWNNFKVELLVECESLEEINKEEIRLIKEYNSTNHQIGYNITGGGGGQLGYSPTEETREKLRKSSAGNQYFAGHTHSQEWKDNMSKIMTGRKFSEETIEKMRESAKGRSMSKANKASAESRRGKPLPDAVKLKLSNIMKERKFSEETCRKISESLKGRTFKLSEEAKRKISIANSKREVTDSLRDNISKGKSKFIYIYDNKEFIGNRKMIEYIRSLGYPKFSQSSLDKIVYGGTVKGYEFLTNQITFRLKKDVS